MEGDLERYIYNWLNLVSDPFLHNDRCSAIGANLCLRVWLVVQQRLKVGHKVENFFYFFPPKSFILTLKSGLQDQCYGNCDI
jgi:hypothetical protein